MYTIAMGLLKAQGLIREHAQVSVDILPTICMQADPQQIGSAMATVLGFYPPGTYVQLLNGEKAVVAARANLPQVVSIINPGGMLLSTYLYRDITDPHFAIRAPLNAEKVKVNLDKVHAQRKH